MRDEQKKTTTKKAIDARLDATDQTVVAVVVVGAVVVASDEYVAPKVGVASATVVEVALSNQASLLLLFLPLRSPLRPPLRPPLLPVP